MMVTCSPRGLVGDKLGAQVPLNWLQARATLSTTGQTLARLTNIRRRIIDVTGVLEEQFLAALSNYISVLSFVGFEYPNQAKR